MSRPSRDALGACAWAVGVVLVGALLAVAFGAPQPLVIFGACSIPLWLVALVARGPRPTGRRHMLHRWHDVEPVCSDGSSDGPPPPGVRYQACAREGCEARRVLERPHGGYRGGGDLEDEWVRTGVMPVMRPPRGGGSTTPPFGSGGVGNLPRNR